MNFVRNPLRKGTWNSWSKIWWKKTLPIKLHHMSIKYMNDNFKNLFISVNTFLYNGFLAATCSERLYRLPIYIYTRTQYSLATEHSKYISTSVTVKTARVAFQGDLACHVKNETRNHCLYICQMETILNFHILWSRNCVRMLLLVQKTQVNQSKKKMYCHGTLKLCWCCYSRVKNYVPIQKDWDILWANDLK